MRGRVLTFALLTILGVVGCGSSGSNTPSPQAVRAAVTAFVHAAHAKNYTTVCSLMTPYARAEEQKAQSSIAQQQSEQAHGKPEPLPKFTCPQALAQPGVMTNAMSWDYLSDSDVAKAEIHWISKTQAELIEKLADYTLYQENGHWLVNGI